MKLHSDSFHDQGVIPERHAFARIDPGAHVTLADNHNPHLAWDGVPDGTRSFVVLVVDPDAPTVADDVNQPDREVPASLARTDFFHWVLVDVPADVREIAAGQYSRTVTPRGKAGPMAQGGVRQGLNDYTGWFANDRDMNGDYFGYDGPCPPWNDALVHRYVFTVHALDVPELSLPRRFAGPDVRQAMVDHVLAQASLTATYTLNPRLRGG